MTPAAAFRRAAQMVRDYAATIRVDGFAGDDECDRKAREKGALHMLANRIEDEAKGLVAQKEPEEWRHD
jgi:hypothetical protein